MVVYTADGHRWSVRLEPSAKRALLVKRDDWDEERAALAIFQYGKEDGVEVDRLQLMSEIHGNDIYRGWGPEDVEAARRDADVNGKYVAGYNKYGKRCIRIIIETVLRGMLLVSRDKRYGDGTVRKGIRSARIESVQGEL